jgi:hypothetical protein
MGGFSDKNEHIMPTILVAVYRILVLPSIAGEIAQAPGKLFCSAKGNHQCREVR